MHPANIKNHNGELRSRPYDAYPGRHSSSHLRPGASVTTVIRDPERGGFGVEISRGGRLTEQRLTNIVRRAYIVGEPDTFFSIPARISLGGKKISGYVSTSWLDDESDEVVYTFTPYRYMISYKYFREYMEKQKVLDHGQ